MEKQCLTTCFKLLPHDCWIKCCSAFSHRAWFTVEFTEANSYATLLLFIMLSHCLWVMWSSAVWGFEGHGHRDTLESVCGVSELRAFWCSSVAAGAIPLADCCLVAQAGGQAGKWWLWGPLTNFVKAEVLTSWGKKTVYSL